MRIVFIMIMILLVIGCSNDRTVPQERFTKTQGIIADNVTGLEWRVRGPNSADWYVAVEWVDNLGGDWRLPTRNELIELYDAGISYWDWGIFFFENRGGSGAVWTSEYRDNVYVWAVDFTNGDDQYYAASWWGARAFAVR